MVQPDKPDRSRKCAFEVWGASELRLSLMCHIYAYITNLTHCARVSLDASNSLLESQVLLNILLLCIHTCQ